MKIIRHILIALCISALAWFIAQSISDWYIDLLKSSGGLVTASEILGGKFIPYVISLIVFCGYLKIAID